MPRVNTLDVYVYLRTESASYIFWYSLLVHRPEASWHRREPVSPSGVVRFAKVFHGKPGDFLALALPTSTLYTGIDSTVTYS